MRILLTSLITIVFFSLAKGQSDTYFAFPPLYEWEGGQHEIDVYISTSAPSSNVWIYNSDTTFSQNVTVTSGALTTISLSAVIPALQSTYGARNLTWSNLVKSKDALFVEATQPVTVTQRIKHQYNQEIITGKGRNALGTDFYVASQTLIERTDVGPNTNYMGMHYISVVALEDSTQIRFKARTGNLFDNGRDSVLFVLDKGESWVSTMTDNYELLGTRVTSNKPIAVTAGGNHLKNSSAGNADAGIDQVVPVQHLGTKHVVLRGLNHYPQDYIMWITTAPQTSVSVDGNPVQTNVGAGSVYTYSMAGQASSPGKPFIIESTAPIYVFQVTTGTTSNDPEQGMAQIPHVDCTGSNFIRYNKASGLATSALITIPTSAVSTLDYNGSAITNYANITAQQSAYDSAWTGLYIPPGTLTNNFVLSCPTPFHLGIVAGLGTSTGLYGYISGFDDDMDLLDPVFALPVSEIDQGNLCATPVELNFGYRTCADSIEVVSTQILLGNGIVTDSISTDTILHVIVDPAYTGPVRVKVVVEDNDGRQDSIFYDFQYYGSEYNPITIDSAAVCNTQPVVLEVNELGLSYLWSNGDTNNTATYSQSGWAWVTVDMGLCQFTDSVFLIDGSAYQPKYLDTAYCDSVVWDLSSPVLQDLYWPHLAKSVTQLTFYETGFYTFIATDINGCTVTDSVHVRIIPPPSIDQGFSCPQYTLTATGYTSFIALEIGGQRYLEPQLDTLFPFAGTHELTLIAVDSCGRMDTIHRILEVDCIDDLLLYVPNAFTPNGDGVNDSFCISSSIPERTTFSVFDRWGNQLFEGPSTECWDPISLGQDVIQGAYSVRTFTRLPSNELHIHNYTVMVIE